MATLGAGATSDAIPVPGDEHVLITKEKRFAVELWDLRSETLERTISEGFRSGRQLP